MNYFIKVGGTAWCERVFVPAYKDIVERTGLDWCGHITLEDAEKYAQRLRDEGLKDVEIIEGTCDAYMNGGWYGPASEEAK